MRHWRTPLSSKLSGEHQSAENSADTWLAEEPADQPFGSSLACLRCRRLISPFTAVTINCAFVSPSMRLLSKSATTSCGKRALSCCDLLLVEPVAITESPHDRCDSVYANKMIIKDLKCDSLGSNFKSQGAIHLVSAKPGSARTLTGPLTTNDRISIEAAMKNHTTHPQGRDSLTPNKFAWRFLALSVTESSIVRINAATEREARNQSPVGCVMVFAGRLPVQGVSHA
ncbi:host cell division inhibitor Icd-like protein [Enterobacteriaceae bacterium ML5]|nr:host cell division inhibitor Icd-like protein [Enterobacteriaceae bacterium ML5]